MTTKEREALIEVWDIRAHDLLREHFPSEDWPWELPDALIHAFEQVHALAIGGVKPSP